MIKKGMWVQIHNIILEPEERAEQVPEDTKKVPLEMWVKGYLKEDCKIGEECEIKTITGRYVVGKLVGEGRRYEHDFGEFVPELNEIKVRIEKVLEV